jgi:hypothetical protein
MNPLELWRAWRLWGKVKTMDKKALIKLGVAAVVAAVSAAGAQFTTSDVVNWSAVLSAVITTVVAYVQKPPQ